MQKLHQLPDDILIQIFSTIDINTLFSLQLTCTSIYSVISAYIKAIAPNVARNTFPGCNVLLTLPESGYSLQWLHSLFPAHLASIVLDKDKLRRHPYINSGFLYGIPSESDCDEAKQWRRRVANGWRVLNLFYLISKAVYEKSGDEFKRPNAMRRLSGGMKSSRLWQAMSCPYAGCTEHGLKRVFDGRKHHDTKDGHCEKKEDIIRSVRRTESMVLEKRLDLVEHLPDQDLLDYVYLWRILQWTFRPYRKPDVYILDALQDWSRHVEDIPQTSWSPVINDIAQGCSWLNWFVLSVGPTPFLQQWSFTQTPSSTSKATQTNLLRDKIWHAYNARTPHQIELERETICKFEFELRKRCLSPPRLKSLETELFRGRQIQTISLDCIPWVYDQHHSIPRPARDFPWYKAGERVWLDGDWFMKMRPGRMWAQPRRLIASLLRDEIRASETYGRDEYDARKGPLATVPYLIYLGVEEVGKVWAGSETEATELVW